MKKNQMIAIAIVAVVAIASISIVAANMLKKNSGPDLIFANGNKDCYEPTWLADQLGYYKEFGADVEMLQVTGGGKALEALQSGRADIAGFGSTPLANQLNKNVDDDIVVLGRWMGGRSYTEMATKVTDDKKVYDFNDPDGGKSITVTYFGDKKDVVTTMPLKGSHMKIGMDITTGYKAAIISYCDTAGLTVTFDESEYDSKDICVVHLEFGTQVASLNRGDVDAIMGGSYDLAAYATLENCVLSSPSEEKYPTLVSEATCVLAATKEAYAEKYDKIVGVLKALQKACCYIYGIDYSDGLHLDKSVIIEKQAAIPDDRKKELFGDVPKSDNGFYYTIDSCSRIADFFGPPFSTDVQRLSYDKYIWGIDFELADMKIVEATYNSSSTGTNPFRTLNSMDYMNYFDGRALYDALKDSSGKSFWSITSWYGDAAIYFDTLYNHKYTFTTAADTYKIYTDVEDETWILRITKADGTKFQGSVDSVTMGGNAVAFTYDSAVSMITIGAPVTGNIVVTATP